jgi:hypothetical protein
MRVTTNSANGTAHYGGPQDWSDSHVTTTCGRVPGLAEDFTPLTGRGVTAYTGPAPLTYGTRSSGHRSPLSCPAPPPPFITRSALPFFYSIPLGGGDNREFVTVIQGW